MIIIILSPLILSLPSLSLSLSLPFSLSLSSLSSLSLSLQASDAMFSFQFNNPGDEYYLAARLNPNNSAYLDITLEADAAGWVAIGFSDNDQMVIIHTP